MDVGKGMVGSVLWGWFIVLMCESVEAVECFGEHLGIVFEFEHNCKAMSARKSISLPSIARASMQSNIDAVFSENLAVESSDLIIVLIYRMKCISPCVIVDHVLNFIEISLMRIPDVRDVIHHTSSSTDGG